MRATVALAAVLAVAFAGFGAERFWRLHASDAAARSALETTITLAALAATGLLLANFRHTRRLRDLLLLSALAMAGVTDFVFNALPAYGYQTGIYGAGARMALAILLGGSLAAAAFVPARRIVARGRRIGRIAIPAALCWLALGEAIDLIAGPVRIEGSLVKFEPVATVADLAAFALLVVAAAGFSQRREHAGPGARLLGAAALLLAGVQLSKLALPVVPATWMLPGDALRVGFYGLTLTFGAHLYRRSREQLARDAVTAERLRIARDLHDGLAQDLAFIAAHSERLARTYGADHPLAIAAGRALAASRGQIADLEASSAPSAEAALREVATELATRFGVSVTVGIGAGEFGAGFDLGEQERHELVRIAREAIVNAVNHGGARHVTITLGSRHGDLRLRVADDGCGLAAAPEESSGTGLGLRAMQDRARRIGADLQAGDSEWGGAEIDVVARRGDGRADALRR